MREVFEKSFEIILKGTYENIFNQFKLWNNNGINEVNLTCNFTESLKVSLNDNEVISCFETTLSDDKSRIDGLVYSKKSNSIFFIESKKFKRDQPVYRKRLSQDIDRLLDVVTRTHIIEKMIPKTNDLNQYFVFVADHWKKNNSDKEVDEWFEHYTKDEIYKNNNEEFRNIYFNNFSITTPLSDETYMIFIMLLKKM